MSEVISLLNDYPYKITRINRLYIEYKNREKENRMPNQYQRKLPKTPVFDQDKMREIKDVANDVQGLADIDLGDSSEYSDEVKIHAVVLVTYMRNQTKAAKQLDIPLSTLRYWKYHTKWWKEVEEYLKAQHNKELDYKFTVAIEEATHELIERVYEGDEVITKSGDIVRKKINARDLAQIIGILYDKRALSRGDPTQRTATTTAEATKKINDLAREFRKIASDQKAFNKSIDVTPSPDNEVIDVEVNEREEKGRETEVEREEGKQDDFWKA